MQTTVNVSLSSLFFLPFLYDEWFPNFHLPSLPSALVFGLIITDPLSKSHAHAQSLLPYCCCCLLTLLNPTMYNLAPNHFFGDELLYISSLFHYSHTLLFLRGALVSLLAHFDSTPTLDGMIAYRHTFSRTGPGVDLKENRG